MLIAITLIVVAAMATYLAVLMLIAPPGYEDATGFHYDTPSPPLQADVPSAEQRQRADHQQQYREVVVVHRD